MNMKEWLRKHEVSPAAYEWAISNCKNMYKVWDTAKPEWLIWVAFQPGVLDDKTLKEFICWCIFQVRAASRLKKLDIVDHSDDMLTAAKKMSYFYECKCVLGISHARFAQSAWLRANATPNFEY
jgi:hypothetical protein